MFKKLSFSILLLFSIQLISFSQIEKPVSWSFSTSKPTAKVGEEVDLVIKANIKPGWHLYSMGFTLDPGPKPSEIKFNKSPDYELVGSIRPFGDVKHYDETFEGDVKYFNGKGEFRQTIKVLKENPKITGDYDGQACTDKDGTCVPYEFPFTINVKTGLEAKTLDLKTPATEILPEIKKKENQVDSIAETNANVELPATDTASKISVLVDNTVSKPIEKEADLSLWSFFIQAFLGGLIALLTPCVYPIIPMTVSFFTKQKRGITLALLYGLFIVLIYVIFGTLIAFLFGQTAPNFISTHWLPNLLFFIAFVVFGLSFLGLFEIVLPSGLVNKMDAQADRGGLIGVFFMAFTLVLVSFSCTGPIVGTILGLGAQGEIIKPVVGMLGFSLAFAIPFTLFAIFPSWLQSLPKSGGWLNSVKVVLGFLELALALKFLSTVDQVYHWRILDREVFIALWIGIFGMIALYLIGKITMPHDSKSEKISVWRSIFAIFSIAFVVYLLPGMWGAPLKGLSGWLPPLTTFDNFGGNNTVAGENKLTVSPDGKAVKYSDKFKLPHGLKGFFDYKEALAYAKKVNKPLFLDFTGHGCVNCRKMEENVWIAPSIINKLKNDFVVVALYVDDKSELPESEWFTSKDDGGVKKTIGAQNLDFEITKFNGNAQPFYCLVDPVTEQLLKTPKSYDTSINKFAEFLTISK
jgi:thiol:disulfide interchange protein